jgi:hypothetical protein
LGGLRKKEKRENFLIMRSYSLNIAGYRIRLESSEVGPDLVPGERFLRNIYTGTDFDILINVHSGKYKLPENAVKVFDAPYVEEINGISIKKSDKFWSVHKHKNDLFIKSVFPLSSKKKSAVLKFSFLDRNWELWFYGAGNEVDPLEYPLDGLVLYYLTAINGDIMIHASGVNNSGRGYLFSGMSGKGKTTMAKLWDNTGARVIHDDRLILRNIRGAYRMFNTPVYSNDEPKESLLHKIFLIEHGRRNELIPVRGAAAISMVMANCIQHNWDQNIVARLIGSVSLLCTTIPVVRLPFRPDRNIIDDILENE